MMYSYDKFKKNAKRWLYEGYIDVPAWVRATFWFMAGIIFLGLVAK